MGVVEGTPENCQTLMQRGENILVYPGGAREVFKQQGEKYQLIWGSRLGFARMAIEFGYTIVPFSVIGIEDMWDVVLDEKQLLDTPIGPYIKSLFPTKEIPVLISGWGNTILPRPLRLYIWFGNPISTWRYNREDSYEHCVEL